MNKSITLVLGLVYALLLGALAYSQNGSNPTGGGGGAATCGSTANGICYNNSGAFASNADMVYISGDRELATRGMEAVSGVSGGGNVSFSWGGSNGEAFADANAFLIAFWNQGGGVRVAAALNSFLYGWVPGGDITQPLDTSVARDAAGVVQINSGTAAAYSELKLRSIVLGGSAPALTGTCTTGSQTGANTAGTFTATCTAQTVIITFAFTAPTGWICNAHDQSTPADALNQTSSTTTSCTLTGTTVAADRISFNAVAY